ncbi:MULTISPECIES: hypothetical protein [unclassified Acinetobacter]|uniref:hypothetical protein n=1 Tax=unclassified Acinetobacter TaxID=196816 RepID=UPI002575D3A0|nr:MULTISPECIES: hypothetical protein [unclassified Acinetobacter]MDM1763197.1 hypothetical protein [Acinetobacter sp. 226-1]MDM1766676.1 hypothetical protein [Acinetobacter sp. 226-4]
MFNSVRTLILSFILVVLLVAVLFWLYLNVQASLQVSAHNAEIQLSDSLPTQIHVGNYLETQAIGRLDTELNIDRQLNLPLEGRYLADLSFVVETPISVDIDYDTVVKINTVMPLDTSTDLVYQSKLLPKFPIKVDIPVSLEVPFKLKRTYQLPIKIMFSGTVIFEFNEMLNLYVKHKFKPVLNINDPITMKKIAKFNATMYNDKRQSLADLDLQIDLPIKNIHP